MSRRDDGAELFFDGKLRVRNTLLPDKLSGVIDHSPACGWHDCNDRYCVRRDRPQDVSSFLILLTVSGEGRAVIGGTEHRLLPNTAAILPKGVPHSYSVPRSGRWEFYWIHLIGVNCEALLNHILSEHGHCFEISCREELSNCIESLLTTPYRYYEYEFFAARIISKLLFTLIGDSSSLSGGQRPRRTVALQVIDFIEKNYARPLCLDEISGQLHVATEHMLRTFREETGMTPYQYLKQFRLRRACVILETTDMSVGSVAAAVGYQSPSAFIAQFRAHYGTTPRSYRKTFNAGSSGE